MNHLKWAENKTLAMVTCVHTDAKKYLVSNQLTVGKEYQLKNETEEYYFIIDNSREIGGYYKTYFKK